jgi:Skp family chaperone for outer membrane proteins
MRQCVAAAAALCTILAWSACAWAQPAIGIFDLHKVMRESEAGRQAQQELDTYKSERQKFLQEKMREVQQLKRKQRRMLNATETVEQERVDELDRSIQKALSQYKSLREQYRQLVSKKDRELTRSIAGDVRDIAREIAGERDIDYVFEASGSSVVVYPSKSDLTGAIIERYDRRFESNATTSGQ